MRRLIGAIIHAVDDLAYPYSHVTPTMQRAAADELGSVLLGSEKLKHVLITGMSGTGKSTVIRELALRGFKAIDTDYDDLSVFVPPSDTLTSPSETGWLWREDRIEELLSTEDAPVLFLSGTHSNQSKFYPQFDHIVLLSAPRELIVERLTTRTNNPYGKKPGQIAEVLGFIEAFEPSLRRAASLEVVTTAPVEQVIEAILAHVSGAPPQSP